MHVQVGGGEVKAVLATLPGESLEPEQCAVHANVGASFPYAQLLGRVCVWWWLSFEEAFSPPHSLLTLSVGNTLLTSGTQDRNTQLISM